MISAKKARELSQQAGENYMMEIYDETIRESAEEGDMIAIVDWTVDDDTKKKLEELGYKVKVFTTRELTEISW